MTTSDHSDPRSGNPIGMPVSGRSSAPAVARVYPHPEEAGPFTEIVEILDDQGEVVVDDGEVRDHPEVPLTGEQRDAVVRRLGFKRTGPWALDGERAEAPVEPVRQS
ncbi:hypothetical protein ACFY1P_20720 [Streptomyces sp. NPDC001407]|uniref:hypothetical protein n=1 Tax=Streptomyces sp. NPDC001407 TaxID=3364573 RepID=UPI0036A464ED